MINHTAQSITDRVDALSPAYEIAIRNINNYLLDTAEIRKCYPKFSVGVPVELSKTDRQMIITQLYKAGFENVTFSDYRVGFSVPPKNG